MTSFPGPWMSNSPYPSPGYLTQMEWLGQAAGRETAFGTLVTYIPSQKATSLNSRISKLTADDDRSKNRALVMMLTFILLKPLQLYSKLYCCFSNNEKVSKSCSLVTNPRWEEAVSVIRGQTKLMRQWCLNEGKWLTWIFSDVSLLSS